ncbi:MAG: nodulation protein NfeD, partial [bacterium]|nr:nodulation protein NfeD [bacterium]
MKKLFLLLVIFLPVFLNAEIYTFKINGPIETITEEYVNDCFEKIRQSNDAELAIIFLDTPGGISSSMRNIIKAILDAPVPVVVYVSPKGARAASAGFLITIAADIAVMAPGTNMGAAHPVAILGAKLEETMEKKVTNDAVSYVKALAKSRNRN